MGGNGALERSRFAIFADEQVGNSDFDLVFYRQAPLGRFRSNFELFEGIGIIAGVDAFFGYEFVGQQVENAIVEIVTSEEGVTTGRQYLEHILTDLEHRDVERTAAEIVYRDLLFKTLAKTVGQCSRGRLVEDAQYLEAGDLSGVLGRLSLVVIEVGGHRDHCLRDLFVETSFGDLLHLPQHHGGDLGQRKIFVPDMNADAVVWSFHDLVGTDRLCLANFFREVVAADQSLGRRDRGSWMVNDVGPGSVADGNGAVLVEGHDARSGLLTKGVRKHLELVVAHN